MTTLDFFGRYGETARVFKHLNGSPATTALQIYELHRRHAKYITKVIDDAIAQNRSAIRKRQLAPSCLLRLVCDSSGVQAGLENSDPTAVCELVDNYICIKGQCWAIRYNGNEEKIYTKDIGFFHLQILLEHPGATFSASELDVMVRRMTKNELCVSVSAGETTSEEGASVLGQSDAGPVLDEDAVRAYRTRLNEIKEELGEARTNNDLGKIDALESMKEWFESQLANAKGLGGKIRKLGDDRNKVRNRVGNAIRRALEKIKQYDRPLSDHLQKPILNLGHTLSYVPRDGLTWSSTPSQNN
jgi:hypothetical protein